MLYLGSKVLTSGILLINFVNMQCMALIGEQFDESQEICGVVASVRQRQDKLSLWTKTASNEAVQVCFWNKNILQIGPAEVLYILIYWFKC